LVFFIFAALALALALGLRPTSKLRLRNRASASASARQKFNFLKFKSNLKVEKFTKRRDSALPDGTHPAHASDGTTVHACAAAHWHL
jgi:hypothetical protein